MNTVPAIGLQTERSSPAILPTAAPGSSGHALTLQLLALCALGGLVRAAGLNAQSFWYDEAFTARITSASDFDLLAGHVRDNGNPPLYWVVARAWSDLFGNSEPALRSLSALASTLTIPWVFLLGRRIGGERAGLLGAFLFAISPCAVELADEARCYAMLQLLAAVSTWLFLRWYDAPGAGRFLIYSASVATVCLTHYYAFALPAVHGMSLLATPASRRRIPAFLGAAGLAALLFSFWIPSFFAQLATQGNLARGGDRWTFQFLATPLVFAFGRLLVWNGSPAWQLGASSLAAVVLLWVPAAIGFWNLRKDRMSAILFAGWWLVPILGPLLVALTLTPIYATRYATIGLPAFAVLAGLGYSRLRGIPAVAMQTSLAALAIASFVNYLSHPLKPDWRQAVDLVWRQGGGPQPVAIDGDCETVPFQYYASRRQGATLPLFGIVAVNPAGELSGVVERDRQPRERQARRINEDLFQASSFWLALCEPAGALAEYETIFRQAGYTAAESHALQRITLTRFQREERTSD